MSDRHKELDFPRGYHIEVGGGYGMPGIGSFNGAVNRHEGYGLKMKQAIRDEYGINVGLSGRGEMIPNEHSYCEIDPDVKDRWGIPVLRFHWQWSDHELNQVRHMQETFRQILEGMGGKVNVPGGRGGRGATGGAGAPTTGVGARRGQQAPQTGQAGPQTGQTNAPAGQPATGMTAPAGNPTTPPEPRVPISRGGAIIHEVGTVRMGDDPQTSPLNRFCQAHEVKNLFVADAAPFVSNADKNPTHTIVALAWRTAEYLAEEMRKGNV
jgi:choline dehydrogenase-like flavoprotein